MNKGKHEMINKLKQLEKEYIHACQDELEAVRERAQAKRDLVEAFIHNRYPNIKCKVTVNKQESLSNFVVIDIVLPGQSEEERIIVCQAASRYIDKLSAL